MHPVNREAYSQGYHNPGDRRRALGCVEIRKKALFTARSWSGRGEMENVGHGNWNWNQPDSSIGAKRDPFKHPRTLWVDVHSGTATAHNVIHIFHFSCPSILTGWHYPYEGLRLLVLLFDSVFPSLCCSPRPSQPLLSNSPPDFPSLTSAHEWLDAIKMGRYKENFDQAGLTTFDVISRMTLE